MSLQIKQGVNIDELDIDTKKFEELQNSLVYLTVLEVENDEEAMQKLEMQLSIMIRIEEFSKYFVEKYVEKN